MVITGRTDLALEAHAMQKDRLRKLSQLNGVKISRQLRGDIELNMVHIINNEAAEIIGKPVGRYLSLDLNGRFERASELFADAVSAVSDLLGLLINSRGYKSYLIAALGNPDITPDAVGSLTASNIIVTRHLKESMPQEFKSFSQTMLCRTGVLGTSGFESADHIKALCETFKPDCLLVIDALAGSELKRLCRCIQICDSGISPGSGVGNNRAEFSEKNLGLPVIALGVPTVIDACSFSSSDELKNMFVTPRDVDSAVRSISRLLAYGINMAIHPGLTVGDIDMLAG